MFMDYGTPAFPTAFCTDSGSLPPAVRVLATAAAPAVSFFFAAECAAALDESASLMRRCVIREGPPAFRAPRAATFAESYWPTSRRQFANWVRPIGKSGSRSHVHR